MGDPPADVYRILDDLSRNEHPVGPVLEIIVRLFAFGAGKRGVEAMAELAAQDNPFAADFFEMILEVLRKAKEEENEEI